MPRKKPIIALTPAGSSPEIDPLLYWRGVAILALGPGWFEPTAGERLVLEALKKAYVRRADFPLELQVAAEASIRDCRKRRAEALPSRPRALLGTPHVSIPT